MVELRYLKQAATRQGISLEDYLKTQDDGKRYCKVHGLQDIKAYHWIKRNGFPAGFRVLCLNCNFARGIYGRCPHEREGEIP